MSRSYKKNPGFFGRNTFMKRQANKRVRRLPIDCNSLGDGKNYRKHLCSYDICDWKYRYPRTFEGFLKEMREGWGIPHEHRHKPFHEMPCDIQTYLYEAWYEVRRK